MVYQIEPPTTHCHHPGLPCPKCGHTTVVQHGNIYTCINCDYRRDISEEKPDESKSPAMEFMAALIGAILMMLLIP
jgi:uncharacterized Zn finger protein (UPF0148 family)